MTLVQKILQLGGPSATAALAILAWWAERRECKALQERLMTLAIAQTAAATKAEGAIDALTRAISTLLDRKR